MNKFGIQHWQIYSVTVDNGSNVVKAVELLSESNPQQLDVNEFNDQQQVDTEDLDDEAYAYCENTMTEYELSLTNLKVECIRCGSHIINLVVMEVTLASEHEDEMKHILKVVKSYRKAEYKKAFKFSQAKLPPIPNKTRWNNYHAMVCALLEHREFFSNLGSEYEELDLSHHWEFLQEYRDAFQPLYEASLESQKAECSISQFHLEWLTAYGKVKALKTNRFRKDILLAMDRRQKVLMSNNAYRAALFMDPRFQFNGSELFERKEKSEVVNYLVQLWSRINVHGLHGSDTNSAVPKNDPPINDSSFDIDDYFTTLFGEGTSSRTARSSSLEDKIWQIQSQDCVKPSESFDVVHYWYAQRVRDIRLWEIAQVVYAAAPSQAEVERDFSAYNRVFTNARNRLSGDAIEGILKVNLNRSVFQTAIQGVLQTRSEN